MKVDRGISVAWARKGHDRTLHARLASGGARLLTFLLRSSLRGGDANIRTGFTFGTQRPWSGGVSAEHGSFFSGHKTGLTLSQGLVEISPQFSVEPSVSINWVDLAEGAFTTTLVGSRATYTMTPFSFVSAFLQYSSSANVVSANVRLRWEYQPGSELFVVYNDERNTRATRFPELQNRAFIVKINRLFRF